MRYLCLLLCVFALFSSCKESEKDKIARLVEEWEGKEILFPAHSFFTIQGKDFVRAAGKCDFDIDVCYNRAVIDAKSLLGMLYLGICKDLVVKYGEQDECFEHIMNKYAVA